MHKCVITPRNREKEQTPLKNIHHVTTRIGKIDVFHFMEDRMFDSKLKTIHRKDVDHATYNRKVEARNNEDI